MKELWSLLYGVAEPLNHISLPCIRMQLPCRFLDLGEKVGEVRRKRGGGVEAGSQLALHLRFNLKAFFLVLPDAPRKAGRNQYSIIYRDVLETQRAHYPSSKP